MNIFDVLEIRFEPVFNTIKYKELEPVEVVRKFTKTGLLKQIPIDKFDCDQCWENCRGRLFGPVNGKIGFVCPSGFLETPRLLTPDETQGWQFDFNRLAELICTKSNLSPGGDEVNDFRSIAYDQIDGKTIAVIYGHSLSQENNVVSSITERFSLWRAETLFIISPSIETLKISGITQLKNIHLILLKSVVENDFNLSGLIKQKLAIGKPTGEIPGKFPTPAGTQWIDIKFQMGSEYCLITCPNYSRERFGYAELSFTDKRTGNKPNKLWGILENFAKGYGEYPSGKSTMPKSRLSKDSPDGIDYKDYADKETRSVSITKVPLSAEDIINFKTHLSRLRKKLRNLFPGITGDPFPYDKRVYKTRFQIEPLESEEDNTPPDPS